MAIIACEPVGVSAQTVALPFFMAPESFTGELQNRGEVARYSKLVTAPFGSSFCDKLQSAVAVSGA